MDETTRNLIYIVAQGSHSAISLALILLLVGVALRIRQAYKREITIKRARIRSTIVSSLLGFVSVFSTLTLSFSDIQDIETDTDMKTIGVIFIATVSIAYFVLRPTLNLLEPFRVPVDKTNIDNRIIRHW